MLNETPNESKGLEKATERPWEVVNGDDRKGGGVLRVGIASETFWVADCGPDFNAICRANAALIVEAVNNYDALRKEAASLREALEKIVRMEGRLFAESSDADEIMVIVKKALNLECGNCGDDGEDPSPNCPKCNGTGFVALRSKGEGGSRG